jgi:hypothetical protein
MLSGVPAWSLLLAVPLVGWSLRHVWRRRVERRGGAALAAVSVDAGGRWRVEDGNGRRHDVEPVGPRVSGRTLVYTSLLGRDGSRYTLLVTSGGVGEEQLRRLRRRLCAARPAVAAEEP